MFHAASAAFTPGLRASGWRADRWSTAAAGCLAAPDPAAAVLLRGGAAGAGCWPRPTAHGRNQLRCKSRKSHEFLTRATRARRITHARTLQASGSNISVHQCRAFPPSAAKPRGLSTSLPSAVSRIASRPRLRFRVPFHLRGHGVERVEPRAGITLFARAQLVDLRQRVAHGLARSAPIALLRPS